METLHIQFQPEVKEKLLRFLNSFSKNELKIVGNQLLFEETKKMLHERLSDINEEKVSFISIEDYEKTLN